MTTHVYIFDICMYYIFSSNFILTLIDNLKSAVLQKSFRIQSIKSSMAIEL